MIPQNGDAMTPPDYEYIVTHGLWLEDFGAYSRYRVETAEEPVWVNNQTGTVEAPYEE
jgi:hypothetical protein